MDISRLEIMNAAGVIKGDGPEFRNLLRSSVTQIVFGSATVPEMPGTTGDNFVWTDEFSVNSIGLRNAGVKKYAETLPPLIRAAKESGKEFCLNVAPLKPEDAETLGEFATKVRPDVLEFNLGCPNVHDKGVRRRAYAYDLGASSDLIARLKRTWKGRLRVKVSPYKTDDEHLIHEFSRLFEDYFEDGDGVTICNTDGGFAPTDESGKPLLRAIDKDGGIIHAGGMGGARLRPIALRNLDLFNKELRVQVRRYGCGGIEDAESASEYLKRRASGIQIGTAYFKLKNASAQIFSDVPLGLSTTPA
jgi:dihydroorotate dehydrogenase (fumarate)